MTDLTDSTDDTHLCHHEMELDQRCHDLCLHLWFSLASWHLLITPKHMQEQHHISVQPSMYHVAGNYRWG